MATDVDICNVALSRLGDPATLTSIDPPEGSAQADHCARFYPIAVDAILGAYPWNFALRRSRLPRLSEQHLGGGYSFTLPADCVRVVSAQPDEDLPRFFDNRHWVLESKNEQVQLVWPWESCVISYVSRKTPTAAYSAEFSDALAWLLASYLGGSMVPGSSGIQIANSMYQAYQTCLARAEAQDAAQSREPVSYRSAFMGDYWEHPGDFDVIH